MIGTAILQGLDQNYDIRPNIHGTARGELDVLYQSPDAEAWRAAMEACQQKYDLVAEELRAAGISNPDDYRNLLDQARSLEGEIQALEDKRREAGELERLAEEELGRYRSLRAELTTRREQFVNGVSNELIRLRIGSAEDHGSLLDALRGSLGIQHFEEDYARIKARLTSGPWAYATLDELIRDIRAFVANPQVQWPAYDRRFETALRKLRPEQIDHLALYVPEDNVAVSFRDPRGNQWRNIGQGSPGQQTAALLAFVLGYGSEPILLDQPEDDLDNTLIYQLLVQRIRGSKQTRQIVVVTHNPNIVVHGDAELVISLEAINSQSKVRFAGGLQVQEARDEICRVMEGGREAFDRRYRRITSTVSAS